MEPAEVHPLAEGDLAEISRTRGQLSGEQVDADPVALERRLRWLVLGNPARLPDVPPGWILRTASGHIAGSMLCVPQRFASKRAAPTALLSSGYYVDQPYRGLGLSLFMRYLQLGRTHLLFATTANPFSSELWKRFGAIPVAGTDREWFGVLRWQPVVEEVVHRKAGASLRARAAAAVLGPAASFASRLRLKRSDAQVDQLRSIDDLPAVDVVRGAALRGVRDRSFVHWRFFQHPDGDVDVLRVTTAGGPAIVAVKRSLRGYRQQIRALIVLDVWGEPVPAATIASSLASWYADRVDAIVFRCQDAQAEAALARAGFTRRRFDVPIAWTIDRAGLVGARELALSPADGDMAL